MRKTLTFADIDRLLEENERLRATLREIAEQTDEMGRPTYAADIARAALEGEAMTCEHALADMDTAAHWDGKCPLCMEAEFERLHAVIENEAIVSRDALAEIERLTAALRAALPVLIDDMKDGNERSDGADERAISLIRNALEGK